MRKWLQWLLVKPVSKLANRYDSNPNAPQVFAALSALYAEIIAGNTKKGLLTPFTAHEKYIILSDQHKGNRNGSDDFALAEKNYLAALDFYDQNDFTYINLGDSEELWENGIGEVKLANKATFEKEKGFAAKGRFYKIFGNHDLYWDNDPLASFTLKEIYDQAIPIYEGLVLEAVNGLRIFLTHGHQGDLQSDGNAFSKWFISNVWAPLQSYLQINLNTPSNNDELKTVHNVMMYQWAAQQKEVWLVTGHTHQPVFASLTHIEKLYQLLAEATDKKDAALQQQLTAQIQQLHVKAVVTPGNEPTKPVYFNSGCCCFNDGDITGIEISDDRIRLIKWEYNAQGQSERVVLEEMSVIV